MKTIPNDEAPAWLESLGLLEWAPGVWSVGRPHPETLCVRRWGANWLASMCGINCESTQVQAALTRLAAALRHRARGAAADALYVARKLDKSVPPVTRRTRIIVTHTTVDVIR